MGTCQIGIGDWRPNSAVAETLVKGIRWRNLHLSGGSGEENKRIHPQRCECQDLGTLDVREVGIR